MAEVNSNFAQVAESPLRLNVQDGWFEPVEKDSEAGHVRRDLLNAVAQVSN